MQKYTIHQVNGDVPLIGDASAGSWSQAEVAMIDNFPWYESGDKQPTEFRLLYDASAIYAQFRCVDKHIFAETAELNGLVCLDSCVEMFASPNSQARDGYFNLEINCCRAMLVGFGPDRHDRVAITPKLAEQIEVVTSVPGSIKDESPDDDGWWVAVKLPFAVISELSGQPISPTPGDVWRGNFFRCGGKTDDQYGCWNDIVTDQPDYHRPEQFGELLFA